MFKYIFLFVIFSSGLNAESVWTDNGDLVITDSNIEVWVNDKGSVEYVVPLENNETNFIYGEDKLTVCQPVANGSICF